jgi:UDP-GlcNAc:undecaprenyl-phosphate GlcNAc-1-phosphate transferase
MLDDIIGIKWSTKFVMQILTAVLLLMHFKYNSETLIIFEIQFPFPLNIIVISLFIIGVFNAVNLMDGLDGLVTGFSFLAFSMLIIFAYQSSNFFLMVLLACAIGSTLGFYKFNSFPAKIFLGDTGSLFLGFLLVLSTLTISYGISKPYEIDISFAIIFLGVPIVDTLKVMLFRLINKKNPFLADKSHFHHIFFEKRIRHKVTVFLVQIYTLLFAINSLIYILYNKAIAILLFVLLAFMLVFMKDFIGRFQKYESYIKDIRIHTISDLVIKFYKKYFVLFTFLLIPYILLYNFHANSLFTPRQLSVVFFCNFILLVIGVLHKFKDKYYNNIYVFFNLIIFFTLRGVIKPIIHGYMYKAFYIISVLIMILFIVLFFMARERMKDTYTGFFTGFELLLLVFVFSLNLSFQFFQLSYFDFIFYGIIISMILYFWYRIIIYIKPHLSIFLFYTSFILSLGATLYQII